MSALREWTLFSFTRARVGPCLLIAFFAWVWTWSWPSVCWLVIAIAFICFVYMQVLLASSPKPSADNTSSATHTTAVADASSEQHQSSSGTQTCHPDAQQPNSSYSSGLVSSAGPRLSMQDPPPSNPACVPTTAGIIGAAAGGSTPAASASANVIPKERTKHATEVPILRKRVQSPLAIGIDLGTCYSCVAVMMSDNHVEVIPNSQGNRITPSCVAFAAVADSATKGLVKVDTLVGEAAHNQAYRNPQNTVYDAKRLIGQDFADAAMQKDIKNLLFSVQKSPVDGAHIAVYPLRPYDDPKPMLFAPEEISALVIGDLKKTAETYLEAEVSKAVITVPAYFNSAQRQATRDAGEIAGLKVLRVISEPTAAAIAYGLQCRDATAEEHRTLRCLTMAAYAPLLAATCLGHSAQRQATRDAGEIAGLLRAITYGLQCPDATAEEHRAFIFDLGGGTFDVALITINNLDFDVRATAGDTHLGGEDFSHRLVQHCVQVFKNKFRGKDLSQCPNAMGRLRKACEVLKRQLSASESASIGLEGLLHEDVTFEVSRAKFEELCKDLFDKLMDHVKQCLQDAGVDKSDVHKVVLVGGSTRIPKVQQLLNNFFEGRVLTHGMINPDEAVAYGAAVQAAMLTGAGGDVVRELQLRDCCPLSLGVRTLEDKMSVVIPRNTHVPCTMEQAYITTVDNQVVIDLPVYQGERAFCKENLLLDGFKCSGIPAKPKGQVKVNVTFDLDADGILKVSAKEVGADETEWSITIDGDKTSKRYSYIAKAKQDADKHKAEDAARLERVNAKLQLQHYVDDLNSSLKEGGTLGSLNPEARAKLEDAAKEAGTWLHDNMSAGPAEIRTRQRHLQETFRDILAIRAKHAPCMKDKHTQPGHGGHAWPELAGHFAADVATDYMTHMILDNVVHGLASHGTSAAGHAVCHLPHNILQHSIGDAAAAALPMLEFVPVVNVAVAGARVFANGGSAEEVNSAVQFASAVSITVGTIASIGIGGFLAAPLAPLIGAALVLPVVCPIYGAIGGAIASFLGAP